MASRRQPPRRRPPRSDTSDLLSRILVAIPAIAFAITIIYFGGATFALGALALGLVMIHELFTMFERLRPVRLAGFLGVAGMVAGAALGDERDVLLAMVAFLPVLYFLTVASPVRERISLSMAATTFGVYWIGLGLAHAILLRDLDHGGALVFMVLLGTFLGDTGAYLGGRAFGTRRLAPRVSPNKTWEGLGIGVLVRDRLGLVRQPHLRRQLDHRHRGAVPRARGGLRRADRRPVRVTDQARRGYQGHGRAVRRPRRRARSPRRGAVQPDRGYHVWLATVT